MKANLLIIAVICNKNKSTNKNIWLFIWPIFWVIKIIWIF